MAEIEYEVREQDLIAYGEHQMRDSEALQKPLRRHQGMIPGLMGVFALFLWFYYQDSLSAIYVGLLALAWGSSRPCSCAGKCANRSARPIRTRKRPRSSVATRCARSPRPWWKSAGPANPGSAGGYPQGRSDQALCLHFRGHRCGLNHPPGDGESRRFARIREGSGQAHRESLVDPPFGHGESGYPEGPAAMINFRSVSLRRGARLLFQNAS